MKKNTLLFLTFIFTCAVHAQNLKVITYNIRFNNPADNENRWDNRKEFLKNQLAFYEPDVFGLQEALLGQIDYLAEHLTAYDRVGAGRDEGGAGEGTPVFYKKDRFRLEKKHTFWLSDTPDSVSKGWDAALPRICTYVLLLDKTSGKRFWVFNTHLDHIGETAKTRGIELILKQIERENQRNYPVVFMGDFNSTPETNRIKALSNKMDDTALVASQPAFGPKGTFNGFKHDMTVTDRIDYIFISKYESFVVKKFAVLSDSDQGRYPSDHLPVFAELEFK